MGVAIGKFNFWILFAKFFHYLDGSGASKAARACFDKGFGFGEGMDASTSLNAELITDGFAHDPDGFDGRSSFGETGRGLHVIGTGVHRGFAGVSDFLIG